MQTIRVLSIVHCTFLMLARLLIECNTGIVNCSFTLQRNILSCIVKSLLKVLILGSLLSDLFSLRAGARAYHIARLQWTLCTPSTNVKGYIKYKTSHTSGSTNRVSGIDNMSVA